MFSKPLFSINEEIKKRNHDIKLYKILIKKLHDLNKGWSKMMPLDVQSVKSLEYAGLILENNDDIEIYKNKKFSDLCKDIVKNSENNRDQVDILIS